MNKNNKIILGVAALFIIALTVFTFKNSQQSPKASATDTREMQESEFDSNDTSLEAETKRTISPYPSRKVTTVDINESTLANLPKAPTGFTWYECKNMKSYFLKPTGWFTREESKSGTEACFVTKEKIVPGSLFSTGLTVNAIADIPGKQGVKASQYAKAYFDNAKSKMEISNEKTGKQGPFQVYSYIMYPPAQAGKEITMYQMLAANDTTGSLFIIIYESPTDEWTEAWKIGQNIIANMAMNGAF